MGENPDVEGHDLCDGIEESKQSADSSGGLEITPEERPRGILSKTDRDYLCGLKDYAQPQTDANRRQDIRERVKNGLKDFALLWMFLERTERDKIFEALGEAGTDEVIESMIGFAYLSLDQDTARFEECIERGVLGAANADKMFRSAGRATDVDVSIDIKYNPDIDKLYHRFQEGAQLSDADIGLLVRAGKLDVDDLRRIVADERTIPGVVPKGSEET